MHFMLHSWSEYVMLELVGIPINWNSSDFCCFDPCLWYILNIWICCLLHLTAYKEHNFASEVCDAGTWSQQTQFNFLFYVPAGILKESVLCVGWFKCQKEKKKRTRKGKNIIVKTVSWSCIHLYVCHLTTLFFPSASLTVKSRYI